MTEAGNGLISGRGRWVLPMAGGEVTQVRIDFAFGLVIETHDDNPATTSVRINTVSSTSAKAW